MEISIRKANFVYTEIFTTFNSHMAWETEGRRLDPLILVQGVSKLLENPSRGFYLLAEVEGIIVGQCMITYEWSDWRNGWVWWIQSVFVKPGFRSLGIYKKLYEHIKDIVLKSQNIRGIRLYVDKRNVRAQQVYEKLGMNCDHYTTYEWKKNS